MAIDVTDESIWLPSTKINIGFSAEEEVKHLVVSKKVSQLQARDFRVQCRDFIVPLIQKLKEKAPLAFPLARAASCLDPRKMAPAADRDRCMKKMKAIRSEFSKAGRIQGGTFGCKDVMKQYGEFLSLVGPQ